MSLSKRYSSFNSLFLPTLPSNILSRKLNRRPLRIRKKEFIMRWTPSSGQDWAKLSYDAHGSGWRWVSVSLLAWQGLASVFAGSGAERKNQQKRSPSPCVFLILLSCCQLRRPRPGRAFDLRAVDLGRRAVL